MEIVVPAGATPLDPDELQDLIPGITTIQELNEFEQWGIIHTYGEVQRSRKLRRKLLSVESLKWLHKLMFKEVWRWAGHFRTSGKNIGVEPHLISEQMSVLCDDAQYWIENKIYPLPECAVRVHHRLAQIHPFVNGNGRHARLVADLIMYYAGYPRYFTWGGGEPLNVKGEVRNKYLAALKKADAGSYDDLIRFAGHFGWKK